MLKAEKNSVTFLAFFPSRLKYKLADNLITFFSEIEFFSSSAVVPQSFSSIYDNPSLSYFCLFTYIINFVCASDSLSRSVTCCETPLCLYYQHQMGLGFNLISSFLYLFSFGNFIIMMITRLQLPSSVLWLFLPSVLL